MRIDPKLIIEFAVIAEETSFTRAAQRLRVAQPWLSARLQKLEESLGFKLLDRTTRRVHLTERGAAFYEVARALARSADEAERVARQLQRQERSVLRIGAAPYTKFISQRRRLIDGFTRAHKEVHLEIETGWSLSLLDRLGAGEIDLTFLMGPATKPGFEVITLRSFGLGVTMSRAHPLASTTSLNATDLENWPIQVYTRSLYPSLWDMLYAPFLLAGAKLIEVPEMAEGAPSTMAHSDDVAAFFHYGTDELNGADVVRVPLAEDVSVAFQLVRRPTCCSPAGEAFWTEALASATSQL